MSDEIRVNGRLADGAITIKLDGVEYYGFTEIGGYKDAVEETLLYGYNKRRGPRGRTKGIKKPEKVTLKGPPSTMRAFTDALVAKSPDGTISGVEFPTTVAFVDGANTRQDVLYQCRVLSYNTTPPAADSADAIMEEVEMQPLRITRGGKDL